MAATLAAVREAIRTTLQTAIPGLNVYAYEVEQITTPALMVYPTESEPLNLPETEMLQTIDLLLAIQRTDLVAAQTELDAYVSHTGTNSIRAALMAAGTLGGVVQSFLFDGDWRNVGAYDVGDITYHGATMTLRILN